MVMDHKYLQSHNYFLLTHFCNLPTPVLLNISIHFKSHHYLYFPVLRISKPFHFVIWSSVDKMVQRSQTEDEIGIGLEYGINRAEDHIK